MEVENAAVAGNQYPVMVGDLARTSLAAGLHHRFVQRRHAPHVERAELTTAGVELDPAVRPDHAGLGDARSPFTFREEAIVLQGQQRGERVAVVDLRDPDLVEGRARHLQGPADRIRLHH